MSYKVKQHFVGGLYVKFTYDVDAPEIQNVSFSDDYLRGKWGGS